MATATATKSTTKAAKGTNGKAKAKPEMDPKERAERDEAKAKGLSLVHFRILKALASGKELTYRDIEAKTGYYSILTAQLRSEHEGSLGALGLVGENIRPSGNGDRDVLTFSISAKGRKLLAK